MIIDTKLPAFKSFMSESKLNNGGLKTTIDQSAVTGGEQTDVNLNLNSEEDSQESTNKKKESKQSEKENFLFTNKKEGEEVKKLRNPDETKALQLKLLNLI